MLGVLGGMGPLATVDFVRKVIGHTNAACDQDHIEMMVYSATRIPDRTAAILGTGEDPYPSLLAALRKLERSGADLIAIPCNTAHYWHARLQSETMVPILHIVDAVVDVLASTGRGNGRIGVLATTGTLRAGIYQTRLAENGFECIVPDPAAQADVMRAIHLVKAGQVAEAAGILRVQAQMLTDRGCTTVAMACTETPLALAGMQGEIAAHLLDSTDALARACVKACSRAPAPGSIAA